MPKRPYTFTLQELHDALGPICAEFAFRTPSIISLKQWSAGGIFPKGCTLGRALKIALDKIHSNANLYKEKPPQDVQDGSKRTENRKKGTVTQAHRPSAANVMQLEIAGIKAQLALLQSTQNQILSLLSGARPTAPHTEQPAGRSDVPAGDAATAIDELTRKLLAAVNQVDDTRRFLMVQADELKQVQRKASPRLF